MTSTPAPNTAPHAAARPGREPSAQDPGEQQEQRGRGQIEPAVVVHARGDEGEHRHQPGQQSADGPRQGRAGQQLAQEREHAPRGQPGQQRRHHAHQREPVEHVARVDGPVDRGLREVVQRRVGRRRRGVARAGALQVVRGLEVPARPRGRVAGDRREPRAEQRRLHVVGVFGRAGPDRRQFERLPDVLRVVQVRLLVRDRERRHDHPPREHVQRGHQRDREARRAAAGAAARAPPPRPPPRSAPPGTPRRPRGPRRAPRRPARRAPAPAPTTTRRSDGDSRPAPGRAGPRRRACHRPRWRRHRAWACHRPAWASRSARECRRPRWRRRPASACRRSGSRRRAPRTRARRPATPAWRAFARSGRPRGSGRRGLRW